MITLSASNIGPESRASCEVSKANAFRLKKSEPLEKQKQGPANDLLASARSHQIRHRKRVAKKRALKHTRQYRNKGPAERVHGPIMRDPGLARERQDRLLRCSAWACSVAAGGDWLERWFGH